MFQTENIYIACSQKHREVITFGALRSKICAGPAAMWAREWWGGAEDEAGMFGEPHFEGLCRIPHLEFIL